MKSTLLTILILAFSLTGFSQNLQGNGPLAVSQVSDEGAILESKIYPNPCKDSKVTIEFSSKQIAEIKIINIAGKEVFQKTYTFPENKKLIDLDGIPNGVYLVRIKTDDQKQVTKKLMISRN